MWYKKLFQVIYAEKNKAEAEVEDEIPKIDVLLTIVAGKVVYEVEGGLK